MKGHIRGAPRWIPALRAAARLPFYINQTVLQKWGDAKQHPPLHRFPSLNTRLSTGNLHVLAVLASDANFPRSDRTAATDADTGSARGQPWLGALLKGP